MRSLLLLCSVTATYVLFGPSWLAAQMVAPAASPAPASASVHSPDNFAGESFVIERLDQVYSLNRDGTGYGERTVAVRVQSDAAVRQFGVLTVPFAGASERVEFHYVRVRRPDGSVIETPVSDAIEQPEQVTLQAPFYSDLKQEQLPVKSLQVGDTLEWQARVVQIKPEAPGEFWGNDTFVTEDGVVLAESLELRVPAKTAVTVWTNPNAGAQPTQRTEGDRRIYRWEHANLKPTVGKEAEAEKKANKTRILSAAEVLDAEQGKLPSVAWTTFPNWAAVGAWYRGLEGDRAAPDATIKAKVAELTQGKPTQEMRVQALYAYVSTQIRYIGIDFGVGRYQPHSAAEVLANQYGDCKDKHTLLAAMLQALGLHPDAVLVGAGIRFNDAVPSPSSFNHVITRVQLNGQQVWLDTTAEVAPYRMLVATIRDHQALAIPDSGTPTLQRTPADPPFASFQTWTATGSLDKAGVSDSHIVLTERGDIELFLRQVLRQVPPAQYDDFGQKLLQGSGYGGTSSHAEISRPDDPSIPLSISLDYHREKAGDWANYRIIPQLAPVSLPILDEKQPPVTPIDLSTPRTETSTAEMKLPAGWSVELPEAVHEKAPFATYDLSYRFANGTLYAERRVVILQQKIPADQWKTYKKWQDAAGLTSEPFVQLTRAAGESVPSKGSSKADPSSGPPAAYDAEAQTLIQQAIAAIGRHDLESGAALLDKAKVLNPEQKELWSNYGYLYWERRQWDEAMMSYRKELSLHPDTFWVYGPISRLQLMKHETSAAEDTLRSWAMAEPDNAEPHKELIGILLSDHNNAGALTAANNALANLPETPRSDPGLQLEIGQAQLQAGNTALGKATLLALLKSTDDASMTNSAAYLLADNDEELMLADQTERSVLRKLTAETQSWTLDEAPKTLAQQTSLLVASWDTMGWIFFREGKLQQAESYVQAAWLNSLRDDVGEHLVEIRAAIADPGRASELEKAKLPQGKTANPEPKKSKQDLRTIPLGLADGRTGFAEYRLLISRGKIELARPTGATSVSEGTKIVEKADLTEFVPTDSQAKLARAAVLNCHSRKCELILVP